MSSVAGELRDRRPAWPQSIAPLRRAVVDLAAGGGATERQCQDVAGAVSEALTNAVCHAYRDHLMPGVVAVHTMIADGALEVVVSDEGVGMPAACDCPAAGTGLAIIAQVADRVELVDMTPGTRLCMTFAIGAGRRESSMRSGARPR